MFIVFLIGCLFFGLILAGVMAPFLMMGNRKKLKEMDQKIEGFEKKTFSTQEEKEKAKQLLKKELIRIKSGIVADKKATEEAGDKISIL